MAWRLPLHPGLGPVAISRRPHTAPDVHTFTGGRTGGGEQTWIHTHTGWRCTSHQVEPLISDKLKDMMSSLRAVDPGRTGRVSKEEFKRVLPPVFQNQLQTAIKKACEGSGETVDYLQFLRSLSPAQTSCGVRCGAQNSPMSLPQIEKHLKEKIGGNLRNTIRAFRLFDYNRGGRVQLHEFRRILDNYCIHLSDKEFQRLWNHYSPNNSSTISYQLFLEKLGFGDSHNFRMTPVCTKLEVCRRAKTPPERIRQRNPSPADPSVLPHRKLQTLFFNKMCVNSTSVWRALQAFDTTRSGLVTPEDLRAVLSSFIFPMNPHSFQKLTGRYGVRETGSVRWKQFLGHFVKPVNTEVQTDRVLKQLAQDEANVRFQDIYPQLKEIFHLLDQKQAGWITRTALQDFLDGPGGTKTLHPRLGHLQITELLSVLDPEHTGVIQTAKLERLNPHTETVPKQTEDTSLALESSDEISTTQTDDKVPVASASQRTVEDSLQEKLCEQLEAALEALKLRDPELCGNVTEEDLKMVLSCYDTLVSDTHSNKPSTSTDLKAAEKTCSILDVVFQKMKSRVEDEESRLDDRIQALTQRSELSERNVRKILEDDEDFSRGRIERPSFLQKHKEVTDGRTQQSSEGHSEWGRVDRPPTTAEQCLNAMKTRIKRIHGDYLTAFRLMDRRRKGVVDCQDFKALYNSLGFLCRDPDYEQLLDLLGLHPGGNLNYAEFVDVVENKGKQKRESPAERVQQRLHELLSSEARYRWADVSKVLCPFDSDAQGWIHKTSLRRLLFTYSLPLTSDEFDQLWLRYDPEQRGRVVVCDFMEKLGFQQRQKLRTHQKMNQTAEKQDHERPQEASGDFTSEDKPEKKSERPPVTPDAVRHIQSLHDLTPAAALERMQELVAASASDLQKKIQDVASDPTRQVTKELLDPDPSDSSTLSKEQLRRSLSLTDDQMPENEQRKREFLRRAQSVTPHGEGRSPNIPRPPEPRGCVSAGAVLQRAQSAPRCSSRRPASAGRPGTGSPAGSVERRLRGATQRCWKEIQRSCRDEDPQDQGLIGSGCFLRILQSLGVSLTQEQFELLAVKFDIMSNGCVSYHDFLRHFLLNLEPAETKMLRRRKLPPPTQVTRGVLSRPCVDVMLRIYDVVCSSWTSVRRCFLSSDRARTGTISVQDFRKVLRHFSVDLSEEEFFHLSSYFDADTTGKICYNNFLWAFLH